MIQLLGKQLLDAIRRVKELNLNAPDERFQQMEALLVEHLMPLTNFAADLRKAMEILETTRNKQLAIEAQSLSELSYNDEHVTLSGKIAIKKEELFQYMKEMYGEDIKS